MNHLAHRRAHLSRLLIVPVVAALGLLAATPAPAGEDPDPDPIEVEILASFAPSSALYTDCTGTENEVTSPVAGVLFQRTGPLLTELTVGVTLTGTLASSVVDPPTEITFEAGEDWAEAILEIDPYAEGTLSLTLEPGLDYTLIEPSTVVLDSETATAIADCSTPLALAAEVTHQTIEVGGTPQSLGIFDVDCDEAFDGPDLAPLDWICGFGGEVDTVVDGTLPPGLRYSDDRWSGTATTAGDNDFHIRICIADTFLDVPLSGDITAARAFQTRATRAVGDLPAICVASVAAQITVDAAATARPATPISGRARFAG